MLGSEVYKVFSLNQTLEAFYLQLIKMAKFLTKQTESLDCLKGHAITIVESMKNRFTELGFQSQMSIIEICI